MRVAVICTSRGSKTKMAIKSKATASRSTYLDIGLRHIGRLMEVSMCPISIKSSQVATYQSAHDDLAGSSRSSWGGVNCLRGSLGSLGGLLHTSDGGGLGRSATACAAASVLTTVADEIVERLVQVGRHPVDLCLKDGKAGDCV